MTSDGAQLPVDNRTAYVARCPQRIQGAVAPAMLPHRLLDWGNSQVLAGCSTRYLILLGVVAVVIMLTAQERSRGILVQRFDLHLLSVRRHLTH